MSMVRPNGILREFKAADNEAVKKNMSSNAVLLARVLGREVYSHQELVNLDKKIELNL